VKERLIDIPMARGAIDTFIAHPSAPAAYPVVIIYMDVWGLREELFDVARRIATGRYYCAVPNFYYRQGKTRHEFRNDSNQMITLDRLDEQTRNRVLAPLQQLTDSMVVDDTAALLEFFDADPAARNAAPLGCIGYCMGNLTSFYPTTHSFLSIPPGKENMNFSLFIFNRAVAPYIIAFHFQYTAHWFYMPGK